MIGYSDNFPTMDMTNWQEKIREKSVKITDWVHFLFKREYSPRGLAFLFLATLCLGAFTKSLVNDYLTIGHDDYRLTQPGKTIDFNLLEKSLIRNTETTPENPIIPKGETCTEEGQ